MSTHNGSNYMSDADSNGGSYFINGDQGQGQGQGARSSRIDDQLEARIEFAESSNNSIIHNTNINSDSTYFVTNNSNMNMTTNNGTEVNADNSQLIGNRSLGQGPGQGQELSWAPNLGSGPNFGPFGGPNFGPYGGPTFGSKVTADRWSELGTQITPTPQGPFTQGAFGVFGGQSQKAQYSTPVGLQFYTPMWSQMGYQSGSPMMIEDRWSGRWHGLGPMGSIFDCNSQSRHGLLSSQLRSQNERNRDMDRKGEDNIQCSDCDCGRGNDVDRSNYTDTVHDSAEYHLSDLREEETLDLTFQNYGSELVPEVFSSKVGTEEKGDNGIDESKTACMYNNLQSVFVNVNDIEEQTENGKVVKKEIDDLIMKNNSLSLSIAAATDRERDNELSEEMKETRINDSELNTIVQTKDCPYVQGPSGSETIVTKGKTYAEVVMSKKELIKEIAEERRRQEIEYTSSPRNSMKGTIIKSFPKVGIADVDIEEKVEVESEVGSGMIINNQIKQNEKEFFCDKIDTKLRESSSVSVLSIDTPIDMISMESNGNKMNDLDCCSLDSGDDDSIDDDEKKENLLTLSDADNLAARRKSLTSNSVSLTKLKLPSPGKPTIKQNNTILNKINSMVHNENNSNGNNNGAVNTLFSVLSLASPNHVSNSLFKNSPQNIVNSNITFNNENNSFNNNYNSHSKGTIDVNKHTHTTALSSTTSNINNSSGSTNNSNHSSNNGINYHVNNTNYTVNNNNNNMKTNINYNKSSSSNNTNGSTSHSSHQSIINTSSNMQKNHSSSGNLQKLGHSHLPKGSVKRHGSLNSISNYGSNNFPNCHSPGKSKTKANHANSTHNNTHNNNNSSNNSDNNHNNNGNNRGDLRDTNSRHHSDLITYDHFEDDLLLHDDLYIQCTNKIKMFSEVIIKMKFKLMDIFFQYFFIEYQLFLILFHYITFYFIIFSISFFFVSIFFFLQILVCICFSFLNLC